MYLPWLNTPLLMEVMRESNPRLLVCYRTTKTGPSIWDALEFPAEIPDGETLPPPGNPQKHVLANHPLRSTRKRWVVLVLSEDVQGTRNIFQVDEIRPTLCRFKELCRTGHKLISNKLCCQGRTPALGNQAKDALPNRERRSSNLFFGGTRKQLPVKSVLLQE